MTARLTALTEIVRVFRGPIEEKISGTFQGMFGEDSGEIKRTANQVRKSCLMKASREVKELSGWMDARLDSFVSSNQDRADRKLPVTKDVETLHQAMVGFYDEVNEPIPGMVGLFGPMLKRCNEWMAMVLEWFPDISPYPDKFRNLVVKSEEYKIAVDDKKMIRPFTWIGGKKELAKWIYQHFRPSPTDPVGVWAMADKVFKWRDKNGNIKTLSGDELRWAYNH